MTKFPTTPTIDYFDERRGYWTEIEFEDDRLIVRRSRRMHWFALTMTLLIAALLVVPLLLSPMGIAFLVLIAWFIMATWNGQRIADRKRFPIVIADDVEAAKAEIVRGKYFSKKKIRKIVVRENRNRNSGDLHLIQVYMRVKDLGHHVLLYQDSWTKKSEEKAEILAQKIRDWLETGRS